MIGGEALVEERRRTGGENGRGGEGDDDCEWKD